MRILPLPCTGLTAHNGAYVVSRAANVKNLYPGLTCKVIFAPRGAELDALAADWLATKGKTPKDLPALPVLGYPGWYPRNGEPAFFADARYFRPKAGAGASAAYTRGPK